MKSDTATMSASPTVEDNGPGWSEIREQQAWDDFLAFCRQQENGPHE